MDIFNRRAFPTAYPSFTDVSGMSIREWLAGMAMAGYLANSATDLLPKTLAKEAVEHADAILLRLMEQPPPVVE